MCILTKSGSILDIADCKGLLHTQNSADLSDEFVRLVAWALTTAEATFCEPDGRAERDLYPRIFFLLFEILSVARGCGFDGTVKTRSLVRA